ncbi:DUF167 domain-containing protein [Aquabacterium sp. A7-Y]|uniref:DUF167 domain-containing protein n=1 Tax=Aquabacterium sp. A7-Y TaxID=1349605 RepID=UPI00223DD1C6|nr:DUF167 domain-containing protein [Aquabacterium sp. A7-Y]MCW7537461.1 DUF167 domain-containing protein [Aquabacterium sp. A7-Y]
MADLPSYLRRGRAAWELDFSVIPNAKRTELIGLHDGALRLRLQAPPVDGKANEALLRWLAERLELPRSRLELLRGQTSRRKTVVVQFDGDAQALLERLQPGGG